MSYEISEESLRVLTNKCFGVYLDWRSLEEPTDEYLQAITMGFKSERRSEPNAEAALLKALRRLNPGTQDIDLDGEASCMFEEFWFLVESSVQPDADIRSRSLAHAVGLGTVLSHVVQNEAFHV